MDLFKILITPADTTGYFIAGYAVFFLAMATYLASFVIRHRNLVRDYRLYLELSIEMEEKNEPNRSEVDNPSMH